MKELWGFSEDYILKLKSKRKHRYIIAVIIDICVMIGLCTFILFASGTQQSQGGWLLLAMVTVTVLGNLILSVIENELQETACQFYNKYKKAKIHKIRVGITKEFIEDTYKETSIGDVKQKYEEVDIDHLKQRLYGCCGKRGRVCKNGLIKYKGAYNTYNWIMSKADFREMGDFIIDVLYIEDDRRKYLIGIEELKEEVVADEATVENIVKEDN